MVHASKHRVLGADIGARLRLPMAVPAAATASDRAALRQGHGDKDMDRGGG